MAGRHSNDINAMPVAPDKEEGYTVPNVHPWTISMESLDYVVGKLAPHIELVYADELINLIKENVKPSENNSKNNRRS